jgi:hypothetical protein
MKAGNFAGMTGPPFTQQERSAIRTWLLGTANEDPEIVGAGITGSGAIDSEDEWSDIDLALAVPDGTELAPVMDRWTALLGDRFGVVHYWDLPAGERVFRVFLVSNGLEIDLGFMPVSAFGARGPKFHLVFGEATDLGPGAEADIRTLVGMGWHHILHAVACIERGKLGEAEWLTSAARDYALALACARLKLPTLYARGVDQLPSSVRQEFESGLVRSLSPDELRRAVAAVRGLYLREAEAADPSVAERLAMLLPEAGG